MLWPRFGRKNKRAPGAHNIQIVLDFFQLFQQYCSLSKIGFIGFIEFIAFIEFIEFLGVLVFLGFTGYGSKHATNVATYVALNQEENPQ